MEKDDVEPLLQLLEDRAARHAGDSSREARDLKTAMKKINLKSSSQVVKMAAAGERPVRVFTVAEALQSGASDEDKKRFLDIVKNKAVEQLSKDVKETCVKRLGAHHWLAMPNSPNAATLADALSYLGDAANDVQQPFIYSATQQPQQLPLRMPRLCSAERLGEALLHEVFGGRAYV